jgi:aryl-alcohol dehydrogenase-like predicted oxidoreductase
MKLAAIFPLGFGTSRLRSLDGGLSARAARRLLETAYDEGVRFFDTAPGYGQGQAEESIGRLDPRIRNELYICTKVGYSYGRKAALLNLLKPVFRVASRLAPGLRSAARGSRDRIQQQGSIAIQIAPSEIRSSLAGSLRRLRRDVVDAFLLHDPGLESISEENAGVLKSLTREGLIRQWGVSTSSLAVAQRVLGMSGLAILQTPLNPSWIDGAGDLLLNCASRGVDVVGNHVLAGLPFRGDHDATMVRGALETALTQPAARVVLCGTRNAGHLRENVRAAREALAHSGAAKEIRR